MIIRPLTIITEFVDPLNPLGLPAHTIRSKFDTGYTPTMGTSQTLVDSTDNIWDIYISSTNWADLFRDNLNIIEVLGANTTGVTNMQGMFHGCNLTTVTLFDTSSVTNMNGMFYDCQSLTSIPLYNTSIVTKMSSMFYNCWNVQSGALALYQQASSQVSPPTSHSRTFYNCGRDTTTGAAELAQIPSNWK